MDVNTDNIAALQHQIDFWHNPALLHDWDFRGCTTAAPVFDSVGGTIAATLDGPICSNGGIFLD